MSYIQLLRTVENDGSDSGGGGGGGGGDGGCSGKAAAAGRRMAGGAARRATRPPSVPARKPSRRHDGMPQRRPAAGRGWPVSPRAEQT
ncbi:unnamed protein product [Angiostrongylus costaricensis]|uniref:Uncharacterized protein n=1 Tax=Angiostrongylus costaricensis TaxID=334426 RepID=A0A0R3PAG2_ANGCS|nr:unnamed protein product [Angiostrongylus costaricensis]